MNEKLEKNKKKIDKKFEKLKDNLTPESSRHYEEDWDKKSNQKKSHFRTSSYSPMVDNLNRSNYNNNNNAKSYQQSPLIRS